MAASDAAFVRANSVYSLALRRETYFNKNLFSDPAWHMLLYLFLAEGEEHSVSDVCGASQAPYQTALRYIMAISEEGLIQPMLTDGDAWPEHVRLTDTAKRKMTSLFESVELPHE